MDILFLFLSYLVEIKLEFCDFTLGKTESYGLIGVIAIMCYLTSKTNRNKRITNETKFQSVKSKF